jgi:hypothetical protein
MRFGLSAESRGLRAERQRSAMRERMDVAVNAAIEAVLLLEFVVHASACLF